MFPAMRRSDKALPRARGFRHAAALHERRAGPVRKDGYPYAVPVSHVCDPKSKKLYFHCFREGYKLDLIRQNDRVSFCVVERDDVVPEEFATHFRSTVLFSAAPHRDQRRPAPPRPASAQRQVLAPVSRAGEKEIELSWERVCVVEITPEHITGKGVPK